MDLKMRKYKFILYKIHNNEIIVDSSVAADGQPLVFSELETVVKALPGPRFIVLDYGYKTKEGQATSKVIFILWLVQSSSYSVVCCC